MPFGLKVAHSRISRAVLVTDRSTNSWQTVVYLFRKLWMNSTTDYRALWTKT